jgi:N,N'-diacetyllegionaminate synthase
MTNQTTIGPGIEIIAELAQGFEGRPEQARLLVRAAAAAGADAAKFQLVYADELATSDYKHYPLFKSLEMADDVWNGLARYAEELGIALHLDIFGARSLALAEKIGAASLKVHGTDIVNIGLLEKIASSGVPSVLLGAGGALLSEIERAIGILHGKRVVVLLGFQGYPTPNDANQIVRVRALCDRFAVGGAKVEVGFADHADPASPLRIALAAAALGAGASVFEKHLTLGEVMRMEDHEAALNPDRFAEFSRTLRDCAAAFGESKESDDFGMSESELDYRRTIRRHVVAAHPIAAGAKIGPDDVVLKRSASGTPVTELGRVCGAVTRRAFAANEPLQIADLSDVGETQ